MKTPILCILLASASLMSSCSNSPNARTGTVIGALGGAGVGGIIGSQSGRGLEGAVIGGGLGALGGNLIGGAQDRNRYDDRYYNGNRRRH
jgi:outer membrane lipoprotein SlyB